MLLKEKRIKDKEKRGEFGRKMRVTQCPTLEMRSLPDGVFL